MDGGCGIGPGQRHGVGSGCAGAARCDSDSAKAASDKVAADKAVADKAQMRPPAKRPRLCHRSEDVVHVQVWKKRPNRYFAGASDGKICCLC